MKLLQSIRFRIIIACFLFAILVTIGYGRITFFGLKINNDEVFNWYIAQEVETYLKNTLPTEEITPSPPQLGQMFIAEEQAALDLLASLITLEHYQELINSASTLEDIRINGPKVTTEQEYRIHEFNVRGLGLHVLKAPLDETATSNLALYYFVDVTGFNEQPNRTQIRITHMFLVNLVIFSILAVFIGLLLAKRVVSPLTRLTQKVSQTQEGNFQLDQNDYYDDEIGALANTLDTYAKRTSAFIEREKAFSRDASHELRTPVASSRAALEIAQTLPEAQHTQMARLLARIDRANKDMTHLIETFLLLGKEKKTSQAHDFNLHDLIAHAFEKNAYNLKSSSIGCINAVPKDLILHKESQYVSVVVDNLIRNAFQHTHSGSIRVEASQKAITVMDTGEGFDLSNEKSTTTTQDHVIEKSGIGLTIVSRICQQLGWSISIKSQSQQGTRVSIIFEQEKTLS